MKASGDIVLPTPPTGPFVLGIKHCCLREKNGSYVNCIEMRIGGGSGTEQDAIDRCASIGRGEAQFGRTATLGDGPCATSPCRYQDPTPPKPRPKPCDPSRAAWAKCLDEIPVSAENDQCIATLRRYVNNWLLNKCSLVDALCAASSSTPPGGQSGPQILDQQCKACHCAAWKNFEQALAKLVKEYCADQNGGTKSITCANLLQRLKDICVTRNNKIRLCTIEFTGCPNKIPMNGACGLE